MKPHLVKPVFVRRIGKAGLTLLLLFSALLYANGQTVINGSFETPDIPSNTFLYNPTGGTWAFNLNSGIIDAPGGGFFGPAAPDGSQYAFLQSGGALSSFSQTINFSLSGTYMLSYLVAGRPGNGGGAFGDLSYQILLDSTVIATDATITAQPFTNRNVQFAATAGDHTLTFAVSPGSTGDNTAFFDRIAIQVPEPGTIFLFLAFAPALPIARAIRRRD